MQKDSEDLILKKIAVIRTDFPEKFGVPRQSGLAETRGKIVFEPEYRSKDALRGLEDYSHLWLIWGFSEVKQKNWHATVRPPRLGGIRGWAYLQPDLRSVRIPLDCRVSASWRYAIRRQKGRYSSWKAWI